MSLSDRLRPNVEAAPWVIDEVRKLEAEVERWKNEASLMAAHQGIDNYQRLLSEVEALRADAARVDPPPIWEELTKIGNEAPPGTWEGK